MANQVPKTPLFEQEIRFALAMYRGVPLAIYVNGVTQEFSSFGTRDRSRFQRRMALSRSARIRAGLHGGPAQRQL